MSPVQPASQITQGLDNVQQQVFDALAPPTDPEDQQQKRKGLPLCR